MLKRSSERFLVDVPYVPVSASKSDAADAPEAVSPTDFGRTSPLSISGSDHGARAERDTYTMNGSWSWGLCMEVFNIWMVWD